MIREEDKERKAMAYGPLTKGHIGSLSRGEVYLEAGDWRPDAFTLPFPERLAEFVESYIDVLPTGAGEQKAALTAMINDGAAGHGVKLARNTLNEWLTGGRDPSVSSSDSQTRENIYRLCAALDLDMELTEELFEKVFFSRAFDLKVMKEFAFFFFARKDYESGIEGCRWYAAGERVWEDVGKTVLSGEAEAEPAIKNTVLLADRTAVMNDREFLRFLSSHQDTFLRENRFTRARERISEYARAICQITPALLQEQPDEEIPYEPLINYILGYTQRSSLAAVGTISSLKSLPAQLTTNFPTGQILRRICKGDVCSYDQIYKMYSLLLFYRYHAALPAAADREKRFRDFLRFANLSLERDGCTELYPRQPYGGLLLYCAAQEDPLSALQDFIETTVAEESETVLLEQVRGIAGLSEERCRALVRCTERDPFLVNLIAGTLRRASCTLEPDALIRANYYEDRAEEMIQALYFGAGFTLEEKRVLECGAILPPDGVSEELFRILFHAQDLSAAQDLVQCGWLKFTKSVWSMDYRVRKVIAGQEIAGKDARKFLDDAAALAQEDLPPKDAAQLKKLLKRRKNLL